MVQHDDAIGSSPSNPVDDYAWRVVRGEVPAGKYHRLACERHLRDRERETAGAFAYRFSWRQADRFLRFARKCRHYKGEWAGQLFEPSDNQVFRLGALFGWRDADGFRRFTTAYHEIPRKNGKTFEAAVVALYTTFFEGEPGAEGYCIATKREQAKRVWGDCRRLVVSSGLRRRIVAQVANLHRPETDSKLEPLGADADSTDGLNPHSITTDEFHAMKTRDLIDVMETATGARRNPLHNQITTAGDDPLSPCGQQHDYVAKLLEGLIVDENFFGFIAHADDGDDWLDERTWAKANPNFGISVKPDDMRKLALKAKHMPSAVATFRQKRLNVWVTAGSPALSLDGWRAGQSDWDPLELRGAECYAGVDLSSKIDLTALALLFPPTGGRPTWRVLLRVWTPADTLLERARRDRAPYDVWRDAGWLTAVAGASINHDVVRDALREFRTTYDIAALGFDPWHATPLATRLRDDDGWSDDRLIEVPQTFAGLTAAETAFKASVLEGTVDARRSPLAAWSASNVVEQRDGKDNILFSKKHSRGRIDPIKATTIAWALTLRARPKKVDYNVIIVGGRSGRTNAAAAGGRSEPSRPAEGAHHASVR